MHKTRRVAYSPYGGNGGSLKSFAAVFTDKVDATSPGALKGADALLLWGGEDIHPMFYKQGMHFRNDNSTRNQLVASVRDMVEWHLMREAHELGLPIIGVCRGAQFLCAFSGGSLIQDVLGHRGAHTVRTSDGLSLHASADHHQMMNPAPDTYELLAWADPQCGTKKEIEHSKPATGELIDKFIDPEVLWFPEIKGLAIQPHPEWMPEGSAFPLWCNTMILKYCFGEQV